MRMEIIFAGQYARAHCVLFVHTLLSTHLSPASELHSTVLHNFAIFRFVMHSKLNSML